jgi:ketosteroid isomerase-like protein
MRIVLSAAALAILAVVFLASRSAARDPVHARTEVRHTIDTFFDAATKQDWDRAASVFASDFEIYTDGADAFDRAAYLKLLKEDDIKTLQMQLRDLDIHVSGDGSMAWAKYRGSFVQAVRGVTSATETAETLIFERRGSEWKIVRAHASIKQTGNGS